MLQADIQAQKLEGSFRLTRVGVTGVRKPITVQRPTKSVQFHPTIDVFVDLPADQKGSHMSRNIEIINEIVDEQVRTPAAGLEDLCAKIARRLLIKHEYATIAECNMVTPYFLERETMYKKHSLEEFTLMAKATVDHEEIDREIGVEVCGMTTCPCAMATTREIMIRKNPKLEECLNTIPTITHNQRNITTVWLQIPPGAEVEGDDLIEIVERSVSSPTFEILKREDEARLVINAHLNPRFVEDVVRSVLQMVLNTFDEFPDATRIRVHSQSEESIHKHNAFAERVTTFGELRE